LSAAESAKVISPFNDVLGQAPTLKVVDFIEQQLNPGGHYHEYYATLYKFYPQKFKAEIADKLNEIRDEIREALPKSNISPPRPSA